LTPPPGGNPNTVPELPDVEVYRRRLEHSGLHRRIDRVRVGDSTVLRAVSRQRLVRALNGRELVRCGRHGKHLFAETAEGEVTLVMHFGMTGLLEVDRRPEQADPHERFVLDFEDGCSLMFIDQRRLGFVTVVDDVDAYIREHDLGPDAMTLEPRDLRGLLRGYRGGVKALLMDQSLVAGIGNIYSDEILFQARIGPRRPAASLDEAAVRRLHRQMRRVLRVAADRGADPEHVPESWLLRHREDGAPCPRGDGEIRKVRLGGRGAFLCPSCQR
jgi:formamidopyrimidine-DNA glycosylase